MRLTGLPLLALVAAISGCTLVVGDILASAERNIDEGREGEGEGEGREGEGEGENPGEGEGEGEDNPACEADERLIVVRNEEVDVVRVYALDGGGLVRRFPEGTSANVNLDNDDENAINNGYGGSHAVVGTNDRLYVVGDRFLYQLEASTLTQKNIVGKTQLTLAAFSTFDNIEMLNDTIVTIGPEISTMAEGAGIGVTAQILHDGDDYLSSTSFSIGNDRYVAVSAEYGYVVVASFDGAPPEVVAHVDVEDDTDRIHRFFGVPKGIAFDPTTQQLLLGDHSRVITLKAPNFIYDPDDDSGDFALAGGGETDVSAIAARGGFAWVVLRKSVDNLIKLDLSQRPPVAVDVATLDNSSSGRHIAVGCRRVFVVSQGKIIAVDRDDLGAAGNLSVSNVERIRIVSRTSLGLEGDD